ncbi:MAG TPA: GAF domain-containing protein [Candidatus Sulfotelmatobacter sp.]|nr:GAF domain-containing protein [Candidatus Sulfotelmatobacter sp.]
MTNDHRDRIDSLCRQIEVEQDQTVFLHLVRELNRLLEVNERRMNGLPPKQAAYNPYVTFASHEQIPQLLGSMIEATFADFGNVQLLDSSRSALRIVAHHGFGAEFLRYFEAVCANRYSCGAAMNRQVRVAVNDILKHPLFQDAETRAVMERANVRACQSTPLFDHSGSFIGVVSTHFQQPADFGAEVWKRVDAVIANFTRTLPEAETAPV